MTGKPRREGGLTHWFGVENATGKVVRGVVVEGAGAHPAEVERAEAAAQALWTVDHRSVPKPIAVGKNNSDELVVVYAAERAPSLLSVLAEGAMNPARVVALGTQLFDALATAHEKGVTHGALSADQLRVAPEGAHELFIVEGLGVRALAASAAARSGDVAADIYAAGQILHQMLLGQLAADFRRTAAYGVAALSGVSTAPVETEANDSLREFPYTGPLVDLIRACLDPRTSARPATAREARDVLANIVDPWEAARPRRAREEIVEAPAPISRKVARVRPATAPFEPAPVADPIVIGDMPETNERLWATVVAAVLAIIAILLVALPDRPAKASDHASGAALRTLTSDEAAEPGAR